MRRVALSEIRFQIKPALQGLSRSTMRGLVVEPAKAGTAIEVTTDAVMPRVTACESSTAKVRPLDFGKMEIR